jgi:hypothetical protein
MLGIEIKPLALGQTFGIKIFLPFFIMKSRTADMPSYPVHTEKHQIIMPVNYGEQVKLSSGLVKSTDIVYLSICNKQYPSLTEAKAL